MNYHNVTKCDMRNGDGLRVVLWVAGCEHHCLYCQNPQTWDENFGVLFDENAKMEIMDELSNDYCSGITLSGGDPLAEFNRVEILSLLKDIKNKYPNKNVWCYTGYSFDDVKHLSHMRYIDVLVDGRFIKELYSPSLRWCGSENQRIIDIQQTLKTGSMVLYNTKYF